MTKGAAGQLQDGKVLVCRGVVRRFREGESTLEVLSGVDLDVAPALYELLEVEATITEGGEGLGAGLVPGLLDLLGAVWQ